MIVIMAILISSTTTVAVWSTLGLLISAEVIATVSEDTFQSVRSQRPAINPNFDPDYSCLFDITQLKCIPGSEQKCPDNFKTNDDDRCIPLNESGDWECPEGYHYVDEDESGQCYPNSEGCGDNEPFVLIEGKYGDRCAILYFICDEVEHKGEDYCIDYCEENPNRFACKPD
jgi:hypothetical protein